MLQFQMPNITREQLAGNRARFEVEPLDRGFGHTFGNALRRVLLSSLEGAAVKAVKIEGVAHEFTTIKGVKEDVTDIILNLKELVCRLHGELDEVQVRLYKDKPGKVVAADIDIPAELEILNPDHHIATLSDGGVIEMMLTVRRGTGYVPAEGNKTAEMVIGVIPIDSIFSPVKRVSYHVESARVGQRTDYDKLILDITTNGALMPEEALREAAEILVDRMSIFTDPDRTRSTEEYPIEGLTAAPAGGGMDDVLIEGSSSASVPTIASSARESRPSATWSPRPRPSCSTSRTSARRASTRSRTSLPSGASLCGVTSNMRHQKSGRKFNMAPDQRRSLLSGLACQVLEHEKIKTGVARAKEVRPMVEEVITLGKRGDLHARRQAIAMLRNKKIVYKLFNDVAPRYKDRNGGYTRIIKLGPRPGDGSEQAYIELV